MEPTPVARRIAPALGQALSAVQTVLDEALHFDPSTAKRVFRMHMSDLGEMIFLPPLLKTLRERAPGVAIETRQIESQDLPAALESGAIDMAIGHLPSLLDGFAHQHLFREEYVTLRRSPAASASKRSGPRTPADYIAITSHPPTLAILRETGLIDRVKLSIPHFMVVPAILAEVDYAVIVPRTVARAFRRYGINRISPLPVPHRHSTWACSGRDGSVPSRASRGCAPWSSSCCASRGTGPADARVARLRNGRSRLAGFLGTRRHRVDANVPVSQRLPLPPAWPPPFRRPPLPIDPRSGPWPSATW